MSTPSSDGDRALPRKRGRSVPAVYGIVSLVLVVGAVTFALSTPPPSTPPLAAVAPAPQEQLEVERVEQSSQFGEGTGGAGDCVPGDAGCAGVGEAELADEQDAPGQPPAGDRGEPDVVETRAPGDLRRCVHGPGGARQTEDPQSPPCIAEIFTGDNDGATWRGVTATTVRIGFVHAEGEEQPYGSNNENEDLFPAWISHFNLHYEFHGRQLEFVPIAAQAGVGPEVDRAAARTVAEADVFAVLSYRGFGQFHRELADQGIVHTVDAYKAGMVTSAQLAENGPYAWGVYPTLDQNLDATGELVCGALARRDAQHGGDDVATRTRRFGVVVQQPGVLRYDDGPLVSRLSACGADHRRYPTDWRKDDPAALVRRIRDDGVTTIICVCDGLDKSHLEAAEALEYTPEWLLPGIDDSRVLLRDRALNDDAVPRAQLAHTFGLWSGPRRRPVDGLGRTYRSDQEYWFRAARDEDPTVAEPVSGDSPYTWYAQLLTLASGIQWAGPELTPDTFADALTGLRFPNPHVGAVPWYQSAVGFGPTDRGFQSDHALFWWRDPDDGAYESRSDFGEVCFVGDGLRYTATTLPSDADELFFDLEAGCR